MIKIEKYFATWCSPCSTLGKVMKTVDPELLSKFEIEEIDVDENQDRAETAGILGIPFVRFVDSSGNVVGSFKGALSRTKLEEKLKAVLDTQEAA